MAEHGTTHSNDDIHQACSSGIKDLQKEPGCVGLSNLGNTCFMNAGLQCLFSNSSIAKYFIENFKVDDSNKETLAGSFADLIQRCWSGQFRLVQPRKFKASIGLCHPQFKDYRQHDCQEFLALLLDGLHEILNNPCQDPRDASPCPVTFSTAPTTTTIETSCNNDNTTTASILLAGASEEVSSFEESSESGICVSERGEIRKHGQAASTVECDGQFVTTGSVAQLTDAQCLSEDSNLSEPVTEDSQNSDGLHRACKRGGGGGQSSVILDVPKIMNINLDSNFIGSMDVDSCGDNKEKLVDAIQSSGKILPSIEDFCMKDTRTLNTNLLLVDDEIAHISTDSDKFHKPLNINRNNISETLEKDDALMYAQFSDFVDASMSEVVGEFKSLESNSLMEKVNHKIGVIKNIQSSCRIKETNLMASVCSPERFQEGKKLFLDFDQPNINNIKRIKIDEDARNMKVNIVQNIQRELENSHNSSIQMSELEVVPSPQAHLPPAHLNNENQFTLRCIRQAEQSWLEYIKRNKSIIVDAFQGQFKNTVICFECHHVSVTFEPFMYLSLPIPHATEQQLPITFVPSGNKSVVRYLTTVDKNSNVARLKKELNSVMGEQVDVLLAEVKNNSVSRILDDQMSIKFINEKYCQLYAFEISSLPNFTSDESDALPLAKEFSPTPNLRSSNCSSPFPINVEECSPISSIHCLHDADDEYRNVYGMNTQCEDVEPFEGDTIRDANMSMEVTLNNSNNCSGMLVGDVKLECNPDIDWQHNEFSIINHIIDDSEECASWSTKKYSSSDWHQQTADWINNSQMLFNKDDEDLNLKDSNEPGKAFHSDDKLSSASTAVLARDAEEKAAGGVWKTCAICLEEMDDLHLKVHPPCGGTFCEECLQISFKHANFALRCPVCRCSVNPSEDFVQLNCLADYKPRLKILILPVVFRLDSTNDHGQKLHKLFGHPNIIRLPNQLTGQMLYESMDKIVPFATDYKILVTEAQGLVCSRCMYMEHCSGCEMQRNAQYLTFIPSDHLVVSYVDSSLSPSVLEATNVVFDDDSMSSMQSHSPITLLDCFEAFTKSELLDTNNPWFCPRCRRNQCARQTMTVWRYPDTLIIHLKRFVYHDLSSTKIDSEVTFPLEDLDLSTHISGPNDVQLLYDLQSYVCHSGGVNSGHYTAYTKHPVSKDWYCYNDESCYKKTPSSADFSRAYVLFYQRKDTSVGFALPSDLVFDDSADMTATSGKSSTALPLADPVLLKRGRTSSGSDLRRPVRHNSLDDISHKTETQFSFDFYN